MNPAFSENQTQLMLKYQALTAAKKALAKS
jgi:hypothetical protein